MNFSNSIQLRIGRPFERGIKRVHQHHTIGSTPRAQEQQSTVVFTDSASRKLIQEIIDSGVKTPFLTFDGKYPGRVLNAENYHNSEVCLNSAFKRALKRTKIKVEGRLSPHDYRDCFRTECTLRNLSYEVGEFTLSHTTDQRGYVQCYRDVPWLWNQISRLFNAAAPQNLQELAQLRGICEAQRPIRTRAENQNHGDGLEVTSKPQ